MKHTTTVKQRTNRYILQNVQVHAHHFLSDINLIIGCCFDTWVPSCELVQLMCNNTLCLKKRSHLSALCNRQTINFCTAGKRTKFATKPIRHYPPHLRHVATLPWEIKNANYPQIFSTYGRKCKQIAFLLPLPLLFIQKFRYFQCLKQRVFPDTDCK